MSRSLRSEPRFGLTTIGRRAPCIAASVLALLLAACGGGSTTGGGTTDSPFVGTYNGATTVSVSTDTGSGTAADAVAIFVHPDGLVQLGDPGYTIYASAPLRGSKVRIEGDASELVDPECSGTVSLTGAFEPNGEGGAEFAGTWSSAGASCFGVPGTVSGPVTASRGSTRARASRVFETSSPTLRRAFRRATE
ncbi:MAG: hypothetical protein U5R46_06820 [Gammaproteobacteria bacterium]|nr:hypothetical protein [Gammaproteobacteria bacterium]